MDLKNAAAICLICLFSASLVLLIARVLDVQAASRIEPQLARIVEELEAIRTQSGFSASPSTSMTSEAGRDGLIVYYFYGNTRCATCKAIESQSYDLVHTQFDEQLKAGELVWKMLNYEQPANKRLQTKFEIQMPIVVLARMQNGQIDQWNRLDRVWGLVKDESAFEEYVSDEINKMLTSVDEAAEVDESDAAPSIPVPEL